MVMINDIVLTLRNFLEDALQSGEARRENWISFTNLFMADGLLSDNVSEKLIMSIASIQSDNSLGNFKSPRQGKGDGFGIGTAPLFIDIYVMVVSTFSGSNYSMGLGALSRVIGYLQEHPVIEATDSPDIAGSMGRLAIEFVNLDFVQAGNVATLTGIKGLPFVLYRLRRLPFDGPTISDVAPAIAATGKPKMQVRS